MRLKFFPGYLHTVSMQEMFSQVIFWFSTFWVLALNNLFIFLFHPLSPSSGTSVEFFNYCVSQIYVYTAGGQPLPRGDGKIQTDGVKDFPLCQSHSRTWKHLANIITASQC